MSSCGSRRCSATAFAGARTWPRRTCSGIGRHHAATSSRSGQGIFGLGPYLNVLPLVTVALFLVTQKMAMPEPTNEQAAMQQKMMKYMTIFMGCLFYKVASGLCLYFIASSLWGIAERKLLQENESRGRPRRRGQTVAKKSIPPTTNGGSNGSQRQPRQEQAANKAKRKR